MFDHLEIRNFKSVEHVELTCRRVNVLIGDPNTGKSNILEALGLISYVGHANRSGDLRAFVRCDAVDDLFYGGFLSRPLDITLQRSRPLHGELGIQERVGLRLGFWEGRFRGGVGEEGLIREQGAEPADSPMDFGAYSIVGNHDTLSVVMGADALGIARACKFYRFAPTSTYPAKAGGYLLPPSGANLLSLLLRNQDLMDEVTELLSAIGLRLGLRADENRIDVLKRSGSSNFSHPYHLTSTTFQRLVFHVAALSANTDSALVFDDPEGSAFPDHARYLAERIALDESGNQYFVAARSSHFLLPLLDNTPPDDIAVFLTYSYDYDTRLRQLSPDELARISDGLDVFSNFQTLL